MSEIEDGWENYDNPESITALLRQARSDYQRINRLRYALNQIAAQQPKTLAMIERNEFVFLDIGRERGNWQHLAFSIYTDLCEVDSIARAALKEEA